MKDHSPAPRLCRQQGSSGTLTYMLPRSQDLKNLMDITVNGLGTLMDRKNWREAISHPRSPLPSGHVLLLLSQVGIGHQVLQTLNVDLHQLLPRVLSGSRSQTRDASLVSPPSWASDFVDWTATRLWGSPTCHTLLVLFLETPYYTELVLTRLQICWHLSFQPVEL